MSATSAWGLVVLVGEYGVHIGWLSVLAWQAERRSGIDAFHLGIPYILGAVVATELSSRAGWSPIPALVAGMSCAAIAEIWLTSFLGDLLEDAEEAIGLLLVIVGVSVALVFFGHYSDYHAVTLIGDLAPARRLAILGGLGGLVILWRLRRSRFIDHLRLGVSYRWAISFWAEKDSLSWAGFTFVCSVGWLVGGSLPLLSNGLSSARVLEDVVIAVLVGRIAGTRGIGPIAGLALLVSLVNVMVGYGAANRYGPFIAELSILCVLLAWTRKRTARTQWRVIDVH